MLVTSKNVTRNEYGARGERVSTDCKFIQTNRKGIKRRGITVLPRCVIALVKSYLNKAKTLNSIQKHRKKRISFGVYVIGVHFKYNFSFFAFRFVSSR